MTQQFCCFSGPSPSLGTHTRSDAHKRLCAHDCNRLLAGVCPNPALLRRTLPLFPDGAPSRSPRVATCRPVVGRADPPTPAQGAGRGVGVHVQAGHRTLGAGGEPVAAQRGCLRNGGGARGEAGLQGQGECAPTVDGVRPPSQLLVPPSAGASSDHDVDNGESIKRGTRDCWDPLEWPSSG